jgi:hypothetical protein
MWKCYLSPSSVSLSVINEPMKRGKLHLIAMWIINMATHHAGGVVVSDDSDANPWCYILQKFCA